jgi:hypothetical protein
MSIYDRHASTQLALRAYAGTLLDGVHCAQEVLMMI